MYGCNLAGILRIQLVKIEQIDNIINRIKIIRLVWFPKKMVISFMTSSKIILFFLDRIVFSELTNWYNKYKLQNQKLKVLVCLDAFFPPHKKWWECGDTVSVKQWNHDLKPQWTGYLTTGLPSKIGIYSNGFSAFAEAYFNMDFHSFGVQLSCKFTKGFQKVYMQLCKHTFNGKCYTWR